MTKERWSVRLDLTLERDVSGDDAPGDWDWVTLLGLLPSEEVAVKASLEGIERGN